MNKSASSRIIQQVASHLEASFPEPEKRFFILGVSGGPDSMSLLYALSRLEVPLVVVHCNYQLRGQSSDKDQELVEETASMWGYDAVSVRLDPPRKEGVNFQDWARRRRYEIFRDLQQEHGASAIVTAHHQDDQLETIIQKILRGAGLTAWQGMSIWNGTVFRPLLEISKADILRFASSSHVPYRLDNTNEESTYARNFLRNGWFPVLDDLFPGWRENILKVPDRAREHQALTENLVESVKLDDRNIDRKRLMSLGPEVRKPLMLYLLKSADESIPVSTGMLNRLEELEHLQTGKRVAISDGWSLVRDRDRFVLTEEKGPREISLELSKEDVQAAGADLEGVRFTFGKWEGEPDAGTLQLDDEALKWPLKLRSPQRGDKINPLGMEGSQSVAVHLTNQKVPTNQKGEALILETFDEKICAVIFPPDFSGNTPGTIAHWARCKDDTKTTLMISRHDR